MGCKGKYSEWILPHGLKQIENWAAKGLTYEEIAASMPVHPSTLYEWVKRFPEIPEAIKKGRQLSVQFVENKFFENACGTLEETTEIIEEDQAWDGEKWVPYKRHVRRTTHKIPPNTAAQIFYLKNRAGYRDNPEQSVEIEDTDAYLENFEL